MGGKDKFNGKEMHVEIFVKTARKVSKHQFDKSWGDAKSHGLGIYDRKWGIRIDPSDLIFVSPCAKVVKGTLCNRAYLMTQLATLQKIYKKKFGEASPYELALLESDSAYFVERMIRAAEICTLQFVLNEGGSLNSTENVWLVKGRKSFLWEHG